MPSKIADSTNGAGIDKASAITPHNSTNLATAACGVYVGGAGDVTLVPLGQKTAVLFKAVPVGAIIPVWTTRVNATGTTATNLVALYK